MKHLLLVCLMGMLSFSAIGQIEKGKSFVTGSIRVSAYETNYDGTGTDSKVTDYSINARYGYMIGDTWAIGLGPSFMGYNRKDPNGYSSRSSELGGYIFARKFVPIIEKLYLHGDITLSATAGRYQSETNGVKSPEQTGLGFGLGFNPGATYLISDRIALTAGFGNIGYENWKTDNGGVKSDRGAFNFNFSISSFSLGATVFF